MIYISLERRSSSLIFGLVAARPIIPSILGPWFVNGLVTANQSFAPQHALIEPDTKSTLF